MGRLSWQVLCNHSGPHMKEEGRRVRVRGEVMMKAGTAEKQLGEQWRKEGEGHLDMLGC